MERQGDEVHVDTTEASGGSKEGVVRWVLLIGLLLAVVLLSVIWMTGAAFQDDVEEEATVSGQIDSMERDGSTDSMIDAPTAESELPGDSSSPADGANPTTADDAADEPAA